MQVTSQKQRLTERVAIMYGICIMVEENVTVVYLKYIYVF